MGEMDQTSHCLQREWLHERRQMRRDGSRSLRWKASVQKPSILAGQNKGNSKLTLPPSTGSHFHTCGFVNESTSVSASMPHWQALLPGETAVDVIVELRSESATARTGHWGRTRSESNGHGPEGTMELTDETSIESSTSLVSEGKYCNYKGGKLCYATATIF